MDFIYFFSGLIILMIIQVMPPIKDKILIQILVAVPLINAIADVTTNYFTDGYFTIGAFRAFLLLILFILLSGNIRFKGTSFFIYLFLFYLLFLIPLSSNSFHSFNEYLKIAISLFMFPLGYYLLSKEILIKRLNTFLLLGVSVIIAQGIISQLFKLGISEYLEDSLYLGGGLVQITYTLVLFVITSPIVLSLIQSKRKKIIYMLFVFMSILMTLLVLRRISIVSIIIGYFIYLFLSVHKFKVLKFGFLSLVVVGITYPIYGELFEARLEARQESLPELSKESRILETFFVLKEINENSTFETLFGTDVFSSQTTFKKDRQYFYILGRGRQLHVDYNILLHGTGIIGLILYIFIYLNLFYKGMHFRKVTSLFHKEMVAVFWSIFTVTLILSFSGSITSIGFRSGAFLYMGSILGYLKESDDENFDSMQL